MFDCTFVVNYIQQQSQEVATKEVNRPDFLYMWVQTWRNSCTTKIFVFLLSSSLSWCIYLYFRQASIIVCNRKTIILTTKIHCCLNNLKYFSRWEFGFKSLKEYLFFDIEIPLPHAHGFWRQFGTKKNTPCWNACDQFPQWKSGHCAKIYSPPLKAHWSS